MITTPGELHVGMVFTVLGGKPVVEQEKWCESEMITLFEGFISNRRTEPVIPGLGRPYVVKAIQLPMILAQHVLDESPVVFDARTLVFRELDKTYVREYLKLFSASKANPQKQRTRKSE